MRGRAKCAHRLITVWIFGAMAIGVGLGFVAPSVTQPIQNLHLVEIGPILMMYPPLAKADYSQLRAASATGGCSG